jgi:aerobic carbon-monoxide dehydrogenase medium subunit
VKAAAFVYHSPTTVDEAVALLSQYSAEGGRVLAGGQSLVPMMAFRLARPEHLVDINQIRELGRLASVDGTLRIGAIVRHATLEVGAADGVLGKLLSCVARSIAHQPIRNRGTFCGSIAHADPSSEWCLVAVTLGGEIIARSVRGERVLHAVEFFLGVMTTSVEPDELITECRIPHLSADTRFGFDEVSRRAGDFAMASALVAYRTNGERIVDPRIGIGGVEQVPRRLGEVEEVLAGAVVNADTFLLAAEIAARSVDPMVDAQSTSVYRRQLTHAVVRRALERSVA